MCDHQLHRTMTCHDVTVLCLLAVRGLSLPTAVPQTIKCSMTRLRDSGRLVRMNDRSHVAYSISEPGGMRLVLDGVTCMFTNEYDPTQLRTSMSGKLAR